MKRPLHALIVEDSEDDTALLVRELMRDYEVVHERVDTADALRDALRNPLWETILCDYNMPSFSPAAAFRLVRESGLDLPFIIVSGTVDDEKCVYLLKAGVHDFVGKGNFSRLLPAVNRELGEALLRRERKQMERRRAAEHAVTRVLAESATLAEATPRMLAAICESLEWDVGAIWNVDRHAHVLRCVEFWHRPSVEVSEFEAICRTITLEPGIGLPGRVWSSGKPAWIPDVTQDSNFPRAPFAIKNGLRGAFGFPILRGSEVLGIVEFFNRHIQQPDEELLHMLAAVGSQIGQFIERKEAEQSLRDSEQRLQAILDNTTAVIYLKDPQGRHILINRQYETLFHISREQVVGKTDYDLFPNEAADRFRANDQEVLRAGRSLEFEERIPQDDGIHTYVSIKFPLYHSAGFPYGVCGISTDISKLTQARQTEHELRIAREIQQNLFPAAAPALAGFDISGLSHPAEATGGDYFDYIPMLDGSLGIAIGDVSGHGFGPALLMAATRAYLRGLAMTHTHVVEILNLLDRALAADTGQEHFVTLLFARLEPQTRSLVYANAGHPPAYVLDASGDVRAVLGATRVPLGIVMDSEDDTPPPLAIQLRPRDLVFFMTDGVNEARAADATRFGVERALEVVRANRRKSAREIVDALTDAVSAYCHGRTQEDDITTVIVKVESER